MQINMVGAIPSKEERRMKYPLLVELFKYCSVQNKPYGQLPNDARLAMAIIAGRELRNVMR